MGICITPIHHIANPHNLDEVCTQFEEDFFQHKHTDINIFDQKSVYDGEELLIERVVPEEIEQFLVLAPRYHLLLLIALMPLYGEQVSHVFF